MYDSSDNNNQGDQNQHGFGAPNDSNQTTNFSFNPPAPSTAPPSGNPTLDDIVNSTDGQEPAQDSPSPVVSQSPSELDDIKSQALNQLQPLLQRLDQTPEEKFKTLMMMIQASDNDKLIPDAYKASQDIKDEKQRAQALLDIVNEINYFSQQKDQ